MHMGHVFANDAELHVVCAGFLLHLLCNFFGDSKKVVRKVIGHLLKPAIVGFGYEHGMPRPFWMNIKKSDHKVVLKCFGSGQFAGYDFAKNAV